MSNQDSAAWDQRFQGWYKRLDELIVAEDKNKAPRDQAWAARINAEFIRPIVALFTERFNELPIKVQELDEKSAKVKTDDHLKRLKALRYSMFEFQKKIYLESVGDL